MVQLLTEVQLLKAVCTVPSTKSNVTTFIGRLQQRDCVARTLV